MRNDQWAIRNAESSAAGANRPPQKIFQGRTPNTICYRKLLRMFILWIIPKAAAPKGWRGRAESPLLASAEAKPSATSKALPHNSSAALAMPFLPSASCRNLDLPPVNLRFLQSHLTKNAFAIAPTHSCGIALELYCIIFPEQNCMPARSNQIISRPNRMDC